MLKFIGTGSAFNTKLGNNSAYIKEDGKLFLIDCGSSNFGIMKESGFLDDVEEIHVYITHTHADHVGSLADLIFYMYYAKGGFKKRVLVYAQWDLEVDEYLEMNGITREHCGYYPISTNETVDIEDFGLEILSYETTHVTEIKSYGLTINDYTNKKFIIYTGDSREIVADINTMLEYVVDYLYVDTCSQDYEGNVHLSLFKLHQAIKKEHRDKVWCMHLDEKFDEDLAESLGFNVAQPQLV